MDPGDNLHDILRQNRAREKQLIFDRAFGPDATQVCIGGVGMSVKIQTARCAVKGTPRIKFCTTGYRIYQEMYHVFPPALYSYTPANSNQAQIREEAYL